MTEPRVAPYGSWKSPITSDLIVAGTVRLGRVTLDDNDVYWLEGRPTERGRSVLVRQRADGTREDVTPAPFNVRTRVHEYGGGEYLVDGGEVFFVNFADQRVYAVRDGQARFFPRASREKVTGRNRSRLRRSCRCATPTSRWTAAATAWCASGRIMFSSVTKRSIPSSACRQAAMRPAAACSWQATTSTRHPG